MEDVKLIYDVPNMEMAQEELNRFAKNGRTNTLIRYNPSNVTGMNLRCFLLPLEIKKNIYKTNLIDNLIRKIRKYTNNKMVFPMGDALKKVYSFLIQITIKWTKPIHNLGRVNIKSS